MRLEGGMESGFVASSEGKGMKGLLFDGFEDQTDVKLSGCRASQHCYKDQGFFFGYGKFQVIPCVAEYAAKSQTLPSPPHLFSSLSVLFSL